MNNVYVTGYFKNTLKSYDAYGNEGPILTNNETKSTFIVKYDLSGTPIWGSKIEGIEDNEGISIFTDDSNIYITGHFTDTINLTDPDGYAEFTLTNNGNQEAFIAKYEEKIYPQ